MSRIIEKIRLLSIRDEGALAEIFAWLHEELSTDERGIVYDVLTDSRLSRLHSTLSREDTLRFVKDYWMMCLVDDPDSEWADSRYSVAGEVRRFIISDDISQEVKDEIVDWLISCYQAGSSEIRLALETACFEHLPKSSPVVKRLRRELGIPIRHGPR